MYLKCFQNTNSTVWWIYIPISTKKYAKKYILYRYLAAILDFDQIWTLYVLFTTMYWFNAPKDIQIDTKFYKIGQQIIVLQQIW